MIDSARFLFRSRNVHTVFTENAVWGNRREECSDLVLTFPSLEAAKKAGRKVARREKVEHIVHDRLGNVISREDFTKS